MYGTQVFHPDACSSTRSSNFRVRLSSTLRSSTHFPSDWACALAESMVTPYPHSASKHSRCQRQRTCKCWAYSIYTRPRKSLEWVLYRSRCPTLVALAIIFCPHTVLS